MLNLKKALKNHARGHSGEIHINLFENSKGAKLAFEKGGTHHAVLRKITSAEDEFLGLDIVSSDPGKRLGVNLREFFDQDFFEENFDNYQDLKIEVILDKLPYVIIDGGDHLRGGRRYQVQFDLDDPVLEKDI